MRVHISECVVSASGGLGAMLTMYEITRMYVHNNAPVSMRECLYVSVAIA